jgi:macrolide-specific efflux system membrane fusion protein
MAFTMLLSAVVLCGAAPTKSAGATHLVPHCLISIINEAQVPAKEAGVVTEIKAKEGQQVEAGALLAQLDDLDAQATLRVAQFERAVAEEEARNDVHVRYSKAAAEVAHAEYQAAEEANRRLPNTYPHLEVRKLLLTWRRTQLEIEKAQMDLRIAGLKAKVAEAREEVAQENVRRRQIRSPLEGVVKEVKLHAGEWVKPGDPVVHVVQLDRLRVEGFVRVADVRTDEIADRPVSVTVQLAHGTETFEGKVVFVSPEVQAGGQIRVWAEVVNRKYHGHYLLRPGLTAEMTIHLQ